MIENSNPDVPFERQMLYILRNYQHLQEENAILRARCRELENGKAYSKICHDNVDLQNRLCQMKKRLKDFGSFSPGDLSDLRAKLETEKRKRWEAEEELANYKHKIKVLNSSDSM